MKLSGESSARDAAAEAEKAELKAMIERKRRNDFVRKRELDMLRRIRREGLSPEQAAALDATSRIDESEVRLTQPPGSTAVKDKIDAIEKQMVGSASSLARTAVAPRPGVRPPISNLPTLTAQIDAEPTVPMGLVASGFDTPTEPMTLGSAPPAAAAAPNPIAANPLGALAAPVAAAPKAPQAPAGGLLLAQRALHDLEVSDIAHDPELDEAVIAFANADFAHAEKLLLNLISHKGSRRTHLDTWLTVFDLFRATGQHNPFDNLSLDFAQHFQRSAPQWFSLPRLVADTTTSTAARQRDGGPVAVGWVCPSTLDAEAVVQLSSQTMQLPKPWVLDWSVLQVIDADGASRLRALFRQWAGMDVEMRWIGGDHLFAILQDSAPVGVRDADPAIWLARLEAMRLVNRPDQFDDVAIDYCVTYEVSPPSWEPAECVARLSGSTTGAVSTRSASMSLVGEPVTTLLDEQSGGRSQPVTTLELSGQLSGDINPTLESLNAKLGAAEIVRISCALLIRVDFVAAGDLLNWVVAKRSEGRHISFVDVHRLVALMFSAMGVGEHAQVQLRHA
ncbi:STAS domain-containing protein [Ideonella sp.]|jgi:ABC-type transporter Mla MlaB component|uniref:STAS domain-containing protein n=1 Tax=Ideonella sp. TaxID=1929293 RepID=UPI0037C1430E